MENQLSPEKKHQLYEQSVQNVGADIDFVADEFKRLTGRDGRTLREDFGGTGALSCAWVAKDPQNKAVAVDLDPEPIEYGVKNHFSKLNDEEQKRMHYIEGNVLANHDIRPDIVVAFNFSYFIFKKRRDLLEYFKKVRETIKEDGAFFLDLFGGAECHEPLEEETEYDDFSYFWDLHSFNPITSEVMYYIHFEVDGKKHKKAFTYDWRMWGMQELVDLLEDAGFSKVHTYWEGEDEDGDGDGEFYESSEEENCESWVTYLVARP